MDSQSKSEEEAQIAAALATTIAQNLIPEKYAQLMAQFYHSYRATRTRMGRDMKEVTPTLLTFLRLVAEQSNNPYQFASFHHKITEPFDYYEFGIELFAGVVDKEASTVRNHHIIQQIQGRLANKENVILLANHQTEVDPQMLSILLDSDYPTFASDMIFVAGERVLIDPIAMPGSMGRNLLCIYSKKYIESPPEKREQKQMHNRRTMTLMADLLSEGGKAIYVAPSGGRDRRNGQGIFTVARFDPQAIAMFVLMAAKSKRPTRFHPLAISSAHILPPPDSPDPDVGEIRYTEGGAIHAAFGEELDPKNYPGSDSTDRHQRRQAFADYAWKQVMELYNAIPHKNRGYGL